MKGFNIRVMSEIAIFAALGWLINYLCNFVCSMTPLRVIWFNGGSITLGYVVIVLISFRRGVRCGILTGVIMMVLGFFNGFYVISSNWYNVFFQITLDYLLPWPIVGICGLFKNKYQALDNKKSTIPLVIGVVLGGALKFLSHFFAGILFWSSFTPEGQGAVFYSFWYNGSQVLASVVASLIILIILNLRYRQFFIVEEKEPFK